MKVLSHVLPALVPERARFGEIEEPFERRLVPFEQAVRAGVSSNLCEAVVKMPRSSRRMRWWSR